MADEAARQSQGIKSTKTIDAFVDTSAIATAHGINEKKFLRKLDLKLLPALGFLYLLSFLDRSNVGNARIEGLTTSLHMTGNEYLTGLTLFFLGYVIFEVMRCLPKIARTRLMIDRFPRISCSSYGPQGCGCQP